jgi:hypothetical protein
MHPELKKMWEDYFDKCFAAFAKEHEKAFKELQQEQGEPDYAYKTIEEYEEIVGFEVGQPFKMGWAMARTTNDLFKQMSDQMEKDQ